MEPFSQTMMVPQEGQFIIARPVVFSVNMSCHQERVACGLGRYSLISIPQNAHLYVLTCLPEALSVLAA